MDAAKSTKALNFLKAEISKGVEFPEAEWSATQKFHLTMDEAEDMKDQYDRQ